MNTSARSNRSSAYLLLFMLAVIWGSSFILMKRGLEVYTPMQIGCLRMFCAALVMTPFVARSFQNVQSGQWKFLLLAGLLGNAIPSVLFPLAETRISSALAGMMNTMTPIFTLLVGFTLFSMAVTRNRIIGLVVGMTGALLLIAGKGGGEEATSFNVYAVYIVLATVCYAFSVNILRHKLDQLEPVAIASFALIMVGVPMGIYLFATDFMDRTLAAPAIAIPISSIVILGVLGTALSTVLFNRLIQLSGALVASSVTYLIPIVAAFWGFIYGETISTIQLLGLGCVLAGVYLINMKR